MIFDDDSTCPVCGYHLDFVPWVDDSASDEICLSCGTQFGLDDARGRRAPSVMAAIHQALRERWIEQGTPWRSVRPPPPGWDPVQQLADLAAGRADPTLGGHSATATDPRFDGDAICPVCGYRLDFVPWLGTAASHRTCPSCGTRFGFHDMLSGGDPHLLAVEHQRLRGRWLEHGAPWRSETTPEPPGWDPERQLLDLR